MNTRTKRTEGEIVRLTRDCDIGEEGELAVVHRLFGDDYLCMTLIFPNRPSNRNINTGADYVYLCSV